jgi:hypothetical protein
MTDSTAALDRPWLGSIRFRFRVRFAAMRPYGMHVFLLAYTPILLFLDSALGGYRPQLALGILTFGLLWLCMCRVPQAVRWQVWLCVPVATLFEVFGSLIWGGYIYRLQNIPLYVPSGHGLVYLFGITAVSLPVVKRHGSRVRRLVFALATVWVVAGLTVLPLVTGRLDVQGAILWPLLAWCILRSRRGILFAAIWVATATLEIAGTIAGAWTWVEVAPWSHLPSGNPPSAIAGGYAIIDGSVVLLAPALLIVAERLLRWRRFKA